MYLTDRSAPAQADTEQGRRRGPGRRVAPVVLVLGSVSLITDISSEMVTAVLPLYLVTTLGFTPLVFGTLDGVYNGVSALVQLTGGHIADRVRNHKLMAGLGYGLSALCKPLLLLVSSIGALGTILALDRTGKGLRTAPRDAMISLSTPPERQGRAFGVHRAMDTTGAMLGPLAAFFILRAATDGYDAVFGVSACVAVLGVLVLVLFVPGRRRDEQPPEADAADGRPPVRVREALALLRIPRLRALALCAALLGLTTVSDAFVYLLLQRRAGIADEWFPLLPLGTAAVFLLLAVPFGALADRVGRRTVFLAGHVSLLTGYGLLLWAPATPALPFLVLALHGVFYAATDGVLPAALADVVPEQLRASGLAIVGTSQALARFCCSLAFGAAWTVWGDGPALAGSAVGLLCCAVVAGMVLRPSGETR
ncbi:MFS transporter [Streptomyces turgidiscabies]|uniref:Transporter, major facilitator family protein n=1 Tax=Streptomyces turgidiscabies (strain Car8) TaxID=698760 RepID=L7FEZ7_STRT8|nr:MULTISPECIES: MFS transporter [Streptomyces]ELP69779.1 transporter, major facilitator family protein [Streptomyces turgidiscabies Car8]MDX3496374.1 MFS transporter [Streptomyces turgidiscabies]GAQ75046.1 major Facilitator Superfamily protein [Streptomyces turgidiscabies]